MWLFPELMRLLRPVILERARPGTRVLTTTWRLGSWQPDKVEEGGAPVHLWIVPAKVEGSWNWELNVAGRRIRESCLLEQRFQTVEGAARAGNRREVLDGVRLRGAEIAFTLNITLDGLGLTKHEFTGTVAGDRMDGTVKITPADHAATTHPWRARKTAHADYFAPTGTALFQPPEKR